MCYTVYKLLGKIKAYDIKAINIKRHHYINTVNIGSSRLCIKRRLSRRSRQFQEQFHEGVIKRFGRTSDLMGSAGMDGLWGEDSEHGGGLGTLLQGGAGTLWITLWINCG